MGCKEEAVPNAANRDKDPLTIKPTDQGDPLPCRDNWSSQLALPSWSFQFSAEVQRCQQFGVFCSEAPSLQQGAQWEQGTVWVWGAGDSELQSARGEHGGPSQVGRDQEYELDGADWKIFLMPGNWSDKSNPPSC